MILGCITRWRQGRQEATFFLFAKMHQVTEFLRAGSEIVAAKGGTSLGSGSKARLTLN